MNKKRRETIDEAISLIEDARSLLNEARYGEQKYKDNLPESFRNGEKGERADDAISEIESAISHLANAQYACESALE
jgi:hypothetical protein